MFPIPPEEASRPYCAKRLLSEGSSRCEVHDPNCMKPYGCAHGSRSVDRLLREDPIFELSVKQRAS